jgi:hypothetical protein
MRQKYIGIWLLDVNLSGMQEDDLCGLLAEEMPSTQIEKPAS